ncbi:hypothetical protein [Streptomyces sp. NPDC006785]|uniref:hypothetical protein n=1 Tax=unclassified Streptomyces TaxID=2593676 RepID=UPI0033F746D2
MNIDKGNVINMIPATPDWIVAFNISEHEGNDEIVCPVIGWATTVEAQLPNGLVTTCVEPAFVWGDTVWTPGELREHTPGLSGVETRRTWDAPLTTPSIVATKEA